MANIDKKPHLYRINGKWYCRKRYDIGFGGGVRTALGASLAAPANAFLAWAEYHREAQYPRAEVAVMKADRELLELAAQADGKSGFWVDAGLNTRSNAWPEVWNPLKSNADAFCLMVRRGMKVQVDLVEGYTWVFNKFDGVLLRQMHFPAGPEEATRRAIVRAVAMEVAQ